MLVADIATSHDELFRRGIWTKSMVKTYLRCPVQFEQRYIYGRKEPPGWAMSVGTVADRLIEVWGNRIKAGQDLPLIEARDLLADFWRLFIEEPKVVPDERDPHQSKDRKIEALLRCYEDWRHTYPLWGLGAVREVQPFLGTDGETKLGSVPIAGHPDFLFELSPADLKCVKQTSPYRKAGLYGSLMDYVFQAVLASSTRSSLLVMIHDFVAPGPVRVEHKPEQITPQVLDATTEIVGRVDEAVKAGKFPAYNTLDKYPCQAKWCGYWGICPVTRSLK